jgi:uncharacterized protein
VSQTVTPPARTRPITSTGPAALTLAKAEARRIWLRAQRLDELTPFGAGPEATPAAVKHLGYVQIDTINVIERCHHHILWTRIPSYQRTHLHQAQAIDKSVFEYWAHALSYVPTEDFRFFVADMKRHRRFPKSWFGSVSKSDLRKVLDLVRIRGPLSIRDIDDEVLVEKHHPWASRKPSKRALQMAFFAGLLTISERSGMLKTYELMDRHFGWEKPPKAASEREIAEYLLDRALRSQGVVSLESVCYLDAKGRPAVRNVIERRVRRRALLPIIVEEPTRSSIGLSPRSLMLCRRSPPNSFISFHLLTRWLFSGSGSSSSSATNTDLRHMCPRRSESSVTLPCRCWSETKSSRQLTSRRIEPAGR